MAFATKYRCEIADNLGIVWKTDIQKDGFSGEITTLQGSGNPLRFVNMGEDDIMEQRILGSLAKLEVKTSTDFAYSDLFTSDNLEYKVLIYEGANLYWSGYIQANTWSEPYNCAPYFVVITATDGLAQLKDFNFKDFAYSIRQRTSSVIYAILGLIGVTSFTEFVNVYENTMDSAVANSPFYQSGVDPENFENMNCYEALEEILEPFGAAIRQDKGGIYTIYRIKELCDITMYGRIFTSGTAYSSTTKTPAQYINRIAQSSNFADRNGGVREMVAQIKSLFLSQDYGLKPSILKTSDFPYDDFTYSASWSVANWTKSSGTTIAPIGTITGGSGQKEGIVITNADTSLNHNIYQELTAVKETIDSFVLDFEFSFYSTEAAPPIEYINAYAEVQSYEDGGTVYYFTGTTWTATPTQLIIGYNNKPGQDKLSWQNKVYKINNIPFTDNLKVKLYAGVCGSVGNFLVCWRAINLYFKTAAEGVTIEGVGYTVDNSINGRIVEKELFLGDGYGFDNDILIYKGTLNVWDEAVPLTTSGSWATRGGSEDIPLVQLASEEIAAQYARHKDAIKNYPVRETHDDEYLSLVGNIQDVLNTYGENARKFAISAADFEVKMREWILTLTELVE